MPYPVPVEVLRHMRELAGFSQARLAKAMGTVPSVLSKLENVEEAEPEMADRYLTALGSERTAGVRDYYARDWFQDRPPSFLHPDREVLWTIDQAAKDLTRFEAEHDDPILRGPVDLLRSELQATAAYLRRRDHVVAWVGDIGVGKTTALTYAVGLLVGDGRSGRRPAFPVGSGRTTVCETAIRIAPTFGVLVDALDDEAVVRLTRDLVSSLAPGAVGVGVSSEIARVLRNMSGMRAGTAMVGDEVVQTDPIAELLAGGVGVDEVTDRLVVAMGLGDRRERQIILPEGSEDGLAWVSRMVSGINNGTNARFGVPRRITVLMPSADLSAEGQLLQVVDTRGVEGTTQRPDLTAYGDDPRTLLVLCTKFADAPAATVQRHLQELLDSGSDATERGRRCILVLPRGDEALELPGMDTPVESRQHGYALRRADVRQALANAKLPQVPTYFFDARNDDPVGIWSTLRGQVASMRAAYAERAQAAALSVVNLRENVDDVRAAEARLDVEREMNRLLDQVATLPTGIRPAYQNLLAQMAIGHHNSIAASIARRGEWEPFQFSHILGQGVRVDANDRTGRPLLRIEHRIDDLGTKYAELTAVAKGLEAFRARMAERRQEFLGTARTIGQDAYGSLLAEQPSVWAESARRYGQGVGYKRDVMDIWRKWFETDEKARDVVQTIDARLQDAWVTSVVDPLRQAVRTHVEGRAAATTGGPRVAGTGAAGAGAAKKG